MICLGLQSKNKDEVEVIPSLVSEVSEDIICIAKNIIPLLQKQNCFQIIDDLPYGLFTADGENKINYFNAAAELITGIPASQAMGKACRDVFKSDICTTAAPSANSIAQPTIFIFKNLILKSRMAILFPLSARLLCSPTRMVL